MIGIIVGGSKNALDETRGARALCHGLGVECELYLCNDMIAEHEAADAVAVSLHPPKTARWLEARRSRGFPPVREVWSDRALSAEESAGVVETIRPFPNYDAAAGSVGFFATRIAQRSCEGVILCGVPMDPNGMHFLRKKPWPSAIGFRAAWLRRRRDLGNVRSCSGWTAELLGAPSADWIRTQRETALSRREESEAESGSQKARELVGHGLGRRSDDRAACVDHVRYNPGNAGTDRETGNHNQNTH